MGIISPIGYDAKNCCASIRCGINRFQHLDYTFIDEADLEVTAIAGSYLKMVTSGYSGIALLTILSVKALDSLIKSESLDLTDKEFWEKTQISIALTAQRLSDSTLNDEDIQVELVSKLFKQFNSVIPYSNFSVRFMNNTSSMHSILEVFDSIESCKYERGIILAVDSLVEGDVLQCYVDAKRILMPGSPNGMIPGEAGAAIMIESPSVLKKRKREPLSYISKPVINQESEPFLSPKCVSAPALAQTVIESAKLVEEISSLYLDLNGEVCKAKYYGAAIPAVMNELRYYPETSIVPAECLGDIGAVTPLVSICCAVQSYRRKYSQGSSSLILAIADSGECGSLLVTEKLV